VEAKFSSLDVAAQARKKSGYCKTTYACCPLLYSYFKTKNQNAPAMEEIVDLVFFTTRKSFIFITLMSYFLFKAYYPGVFFCLCCVF
jgi:hypothetical protein